MIAKNISFAWLLTLLCLMLVSSSTKVSATKVELHGDCSNNSTWHLKLTKSGSKKIKTYFRGDSPKYVGQKWKIVAFDRNNKKIFDTSISTINDDRRRLRNNNVTNNHNVTNNNDDDTEDEGEYFYVTFTTTNLKGKDVISIKATASKTKEICQTNATYSW
jgi:hypothetical protein